MGDCTWFEFVEESSECGQVNQSVSQSVGQQDQKTCLHAQNATVMDGLAKDPAFSVLTASHTDGGRGGKGGGRGGSATLALDAFKANQSSELELNVFPVMGFGTLGGL